MFIKSSEINIREHLSMFIKVGYAKNIHTYKRFYNSFIYYMIKKKDLHIDEKFIVSPFDKACILIAYLRNKNDI